MTIVRRYELTDHDWKRIEPELPRQQRGGRWNDHRTVLNGTFERIARARDEGRVRGGKKGGAHEPRDHALGRSRGGWGTKLHLAVDGRGTELGAVVTAGQTHEIAVFESLMASVDTPSSPWMVAGDKGYSYPQVRRSQWHTTSPFHLLQAPIHRVPSETSA